MCFTICSVRRARIRLCAAIARALVHMFVFFDQCLQLFAEVATRAWWYLLVVRLYLNVSRQLANEKEAHAMCCKFIWFRACSASQGWDELTPLWKLPIESPAHILRYVWSYGAHFGSKVISSVRCNCPVSPLSITARTGAVAQDKVVIRVFWKTTEVMRKPCLSDIRRILSLCSYAQCYET